MHIRFPHFVVALTLMLALPGFASTARRTVPLNRSHHRRPAHHATAAHPIHSAAARRGAAGHAGPVRAGTAQAAALRAAAERAPLGVTPARGISARRYRTRRGTVTAASREPAAVAQNSAPSDSAEPAAAPRAVLTTHAAARQATIPTIQKIRFVPPLRGSRESLLRQNEKDAAEGLVRIQDDAQLNAMRADHQLVPVPASAGLLVNPALPYNRRYCRPMTARFLSDLARSHYARFHRAIQVNSAVRTVAFQRSLMEINGNAAAADGDLASPHLTGAAVDIGKKGLSETEIAWMRAWLLPLQQAGKIDVEEEFYQACFHITVYSSYAPQAMPRVPRRRSGTTLLAARVP